MQQVQQAEKTDQVRSYERSLARSAESRTRADRPRVFTMEGRAWDLLDGVFAPVHSPSTRLGLEFLGLTADAAPTGTARGSFLEVGCGTGLIAVCAALHGHERVVAADINTAAVRNAELNIARHGVADRVRAVHSDLFSALPAGERFDTVFWSSNYVLAPAGYRYRHDHERAYVDPGYATHRRFLAEVLDRTAPGGRALLHFSSRGDMDLLRRLAGETGTKLVELAATVIVEGDDPVSHYLLRITR
ncbi:methyltransferase domain-containing protein [Streptomyces leeuwenhoekii]|uniref:Methyltransferase Small n=1 Tax=Streptomyces leeuwenhoekii TaxID=1437453 RepID=A0A0F7VXG9_STRLW|nr:methyltransferase domain-containing protein [Streptomyces leeuwenhoekii]CQR65199.1 Methyltransferase Small [Streptomyces leeuwenhoekii]